MRKIILKCIGTIVILLAIFIVLTIIWLPKPVGAQSDIAVQVINTGTEYVYEHYYEYDGVTGTPNISIDLPCEIIRDKERQTILLYGFIRFPDNNGSGTVALAMIPTRGEDWAGVITTYTGSAMSIGLVSPYSISIYPYCKARFLWTNPGTVKWKMTIFTRAIVN